MGIIHEVLSVTKNLRDKYEKRAEARKFNEFFNGKLILPSLNSTYKMSLGYLERFLMKAEKENSDKGTDQGVLIIKEWSEGCGYFEGVYEIKNNTNKQIHKGKFEWEGVGSIEETWDMFKVFS